MDAKYKNLARKLSELDREAQIIDDKIKEIRVGITNLHWNLIGLEKNKDELSLKGAPR